MRKVIFLGLIALGVSLPVLMSKNQAENTGQTSGNPITNSGFGDVLNQSPIVITPQQSGTDPTGSPFQLASAADGSPPMIQPRTPVYNAFVNPAEYLNFQITPDWVRSRWPRVSMTPGEDELTGMRVALVSGPRPVDVHGSLTYYFDGQQRLQRMAFRGWTGESAELVNVLTNQFGFSRQDSGAAEFYTTSSWGKPKGFLRLDHPPVVRQNAPTEQLMVLLEIINPSSSLTISQQNQQILQAMSN